MAKDVGTNNGTAIITSNMSPESGDQIDSLWGQNLIDNVMKESNISSSWVFSAV